MHSGWFDPADLTNNYPPITVDLDVSVFGRAYTINAAYSPDVDLTGAGMSRGGVQAMPAFTAMVQRAMDKANARLIEKMSASTPANAAPVVQNAQ
jgi:hypothetical protein